MPVDGGVDKQVKKLFGVDCWDSQPRLVFRGTSTPPSVAFQEGFQPTEHPWIEDSRYLLQVSKASSYIHEKTKGKRPGHVSLNTKPDGAFPFEILPPGYCTGLVSTSDSPFIACRYACFQFCIQYVQQFGAKGRRSRFRKAHRDGEVLGYVYVIECIGSVNITKHFQWKPHDLEQEFALLSAEARNIKHAYPVIISRVDDESCIVNLGGLLKNNCYRGVAESQDAPSLFDISRTFCRIPFCNVLAIEIHSDFLRHTSLFHDAHAYLHMMKRRPIPGNFCWNCEKANVQLKRCSSCKRAFYCSSECQHADWKEHKFLCGILNFRKEV